MAEKQGIPGGNQVEGEHQSLNIDGASDTNYAQVGILAPCSSESCVLRGSPKGCGMEAYLKLAKSHTRVLKKVSDVESNPDKESNAGQESNAHSSFSAMLKIVEYSDSEHSDSLTKISSSEGHPGAEPLSPQKAYFNVHDTLHKEAAHFSESETDDEMEGVKSLVDTFLVQSEIEEKSEEEENPEMEDTSPDSEWEFGKVMETDAYKS